MKQVVAMAEGGANIQRDNTFSNWEEASNKTTSNSAKSINRAMTLESGTSARDVSNTAKNASGTKSRPRGQAKRTMTIDNGVRANNRRNQFAKTNQPTLASVKESIDEREAAENSYKRVQEVDKSTSTSTEDKINLKGIESIQETSTKSDKTSSVTEFKQQTATNDEAQEKDSYSEPFATSDITPSVIPKRESSATSVMKSCVTNSEGLDEASSRRSSSASDRNESQASLRSERTSSVTSLTNPAAAKGKGSANTPDRRSSITSDTQQFGSQASLDEKKSSETSDMSSATKDERSGGSANRRSSITSNTKQETSENPERRSSVSSVRSGRSSVASTRKSSVSSNKRTSLSYGANESGTDLQRSSVTSNRRDSKAPFNIKNGSSKTAGPKNWRDAFTKSKHAFSPKQGRRQSGVGNSVELSEQDKKREAEMIFWKLDMEDIMLRLRRINRSLDAHLKRLSARETTGIGSNNDT